MAKTNWGMNDTVLPSDMNLIGTEINALKTATTDMDEKMPELILSATPPSDPTPQTWWYEDLGDDFDLGQGVVQRNVTQQKKTILLNGSRTGWSQPYGYGFDYDSVHTRTSAANIRMLLGDRFANTAVRNNTVRPFKLKTTDKLSVFVYVENAKNLDNFEIYFAPTTGYTQFISFLFSSNRICEGWNEIPLIMERANVEGGYDLSSEVKSIQMRAVPKTGTVEHVSITLDSIVVNKQPAKAKVVFTFDDGWVSQYQTAFPILLKYGFTGTIGCIPTWVGTKADPSYEVVMTIEQLRELQDYGWEIANHTYTHQRLDNLTITQAIQDVEQCKNWLITNGFAKSSSMLIYPYGSHIETTKSVDFAKIVRFGRTLVEGLESPNPPEKLRVKTRNMVRARTPATFKEHIDDAISSGSTLIFTNHIIDDLTVENDPYEMAYGIADFKEIVDYVYQNSDKIDVVSLSDLV
jgi:hypothetical protein